MPWLLVIIGLGALIIPTLNDAGKLTYNFSDIQNLKFQLKENRITATVLIGFKNPSARPLTLRSFQGEIYYGQNMIGEVGMSKLVTISGMDTTIIPFPVVLYIDKAAGSLASLITVKKLDGISIRGTANFEGFTLPMKKDLLTIKQ